MPISAKRARAAGTSSRRFKRPESVLVLICTRDGRVLLLERTEPRGFWQSVTGSLAWGEGALSAARRELREETGFDPRGLMDLRRGARFPIRGPWRKRYAPGVYSNREHWFVLVLDRARKPVLSPSEHRRWQWLPRARAMRLATSYTNRRAIQYVCGRPPSGG